MNEHHSRKTFATTHVKGARGNSGTRLARHGSWLAFRRGRHLEEGRSEVKRTVKVK